MSTLYAPRIRFHNVIQRQKAQSITLPIYRDGGLVAPTGGTWELVDADGTRKVGLKSVTIAADIATVSLSVVELPDALDFSDNYMEKWNLDIGGSTINFERPCAIARSLLYPVVSDIDLEAQYSDLASIRPASMTSYQSYIDEAWYQILNRLRSLGNFPYLIMDAQSLRMILIDLSCYLIFKDFDSSGLGEGRYMDLAKEHRENYNFGWGTLSFRYDQNLSGTLEDEANRRSAAKPVIYTCNPPNYKFRRW